MQDERDDLFRATAFAFLDDAKRRNGGLVTRAELESFTFEGQRVPLIERQRGIRKVSGLEAAISILTTFTRATDTPPYDDHIGEDRFPRYKWRGIEADYFDNRALRRAMELQKPMAWFRGVAPGVYDPACPVWLVGEEPEQYQFVVALTAELRDLWSPELSNALPHNPIRRYADREVRIRLHQRVFRGQVLIAYENQCALCRLRHPELLDAAHIKGDADSGEPVIPNGLAMCAIHHRAFDAQVLGIRPDYRVEIRADVLAEHDGPTLQHALQGLHGGVIVLPKRRAERPNKDLLEERFERFRAAG